MKMRQKKGKFLKSEKGAGPVNWKLQERKRRKLFAAVFVGAAVLGTAVSGVFAKYYANTSNKGVTTASNCYFSSNLLKDMTEQETGQEEYASVFNTDIWDGNSSYVMELRVRNFQSQILYNDSNLNLTYDIFFELEEPSDGGSYTVADENDNIYPIPYGRTVAFRDITLPGGRAESSLFKVSFTPPEDHEPRYTSRGVKVTAVTTAPDYAVGRKLGGILYASVFTSEYNLEKGFDFTRADLDSMGGLPYTVTYTPGLDNEEHRLQIVWDSSLMELDAFTAGKYADSMTTDANHRTTLSAVIEPYASLRLVFYRTDRFRSEDIADDEALEALVQVEDLDKPTD